MLRIRGPPWRVPRWFPVPFPHEIPAMKILYVNNDGGGFADTVEVDEGTTVASLFADKVSNASRPIDRKSVV